MELQEREVIGQTLISTKIDFQFAKYPQQGVDSQMSRRSTPAPQRRNRLTKSLSVGDSLGRECLDDDGGDDDGDASGNVFYQSFHHRLAIKGREDNGWRD